VRPGIDSVVREEKVTSREKILKAITRCEIEIQKIADYKQPLAWYNALGEADWHAERNLLERELSDLSQVICRTPRGRPLAWVSSDGTIVQVSGPKIEWADYEDWVQLSFDFIL